ncbi:peptidoglycan-binding domain-containing protein [Aristaeella lactis]|uniref:Peptidoglycan binding domain-containing protein n=1 Tax=Aristaeella lactis TaxID=3046383 RepID=A0AC61PNH4_9FIRM|nr:peptidoglycan-binding protein [Aristaeella lactis]QUA52535.1 peptidoglycan-binding protein [Aristaeella lactis]SMC76898.1 Putative peptidoglycan binding domain-containing protein [Aristaeella lactis]
MDLMRTLLIYMSATLTLAVQSTAAPKETPIPSPVQDTAIVETTDTVEKGSETITAAPKAKEKETEKITPFPVPTITPNTKGYHNLTMGTKGKEVKKLQEKLIELKYLPDDSADGAYGRQTYNAVKKFQYYNGLKADGIAGRATQTNLFENDQIVPNPEQTAAPEVTPAPPEATNAPETPPASETAAPETVPPETDAPVTDAPETEAPAEETAVPAETEAVQETETAPATDEDIPEVVENVDLDADFYEPVSGNVALNEGDGPLEFMVMEDGVPVTTRPRLSQNENKIRVSLDDLCECVDGWQLTDDGVGSVVLEAAGYTLVLYNEDKGCSASVDGMEISMKEDDYDFATEGHFINAQFLASALKGEAVWDQEENTLMLRIRDKEATQSAD